MVRKPGGPNEPTKERPMPNAVDLRAAVGSMLLSLLSARVQMDQQSAQLARYYEQDELLRQFPVPSFGIGEATLRLPYAAVDVHPPGAQEELKATDPREIPQMAVIINADLLARLPEHAIAYVELKLSQQQLTLLLENEHRPQ
jgi:hypothetical protein